MMVLKSRVPIEKHHIKFITGKFHYLRLLSTYIENSIVTIHEVDDERF